MHRLIQETLEDTQHVEFVLDVSPQFDGLQAVPFSPYRRAIVFCDTALRDLWWPPIEAILSARIELVAVDFLEACEATKSIQNYVTLVERLGALQCTRSDVIVAVGGGCVLDAVSYLASTYMRGVPLVMIPTTLIGQSDASTAGKTCINTRYAKNQLGTLYLPRHVYNNVQVLKTTPAYEMRQGFSEIFKYGLLGSARLLDQILAYHQEPDDTLMLDILAETIAVRIATRRRDPLASNLGHTFGHALEKLSDFAVNHGDAIAVGIVLALEFGTREALCSTRFRDETVARMKRLGLNTSVAPGIDVDAMVDLMLNDKKSSGNSIGLILLRDLETPVQVNGRPFYDVAPDTMREFLNDVLNDPRYVQADQWQRLRAS